MRSVLRRFVGGPHDGQVRAVTIGAQRVSLAVAPDSDAEPTLADLQLRVLYRAEYRLVTLRDEASGEPEEVMLHVAAVPRRRSAISGQRSGKGGQRSGRSGQRSAVSDQPSRLPPTAYQLPPIAQGRLWVEEGAEEVGGMQ